MKKTNVYKLVWRSGYGNLIKRVFADSLLEAIAKAQQMNGVFVTIDGYELIEVKLDLEDVIIQ